ncbi:TetR family transcriptional regulator [Microbacterium sp.]|uniref:TetR family transcriptional regulator n=1 Tax=Microbacterium sp. TaxID=51671 RepID=UPI003C7280FD
MDEVDDTQSAILAAAAGLLRHRTFEDISYLDLAEVTEVSERTIYRRFPTRSHLLEALARWIEAEHFPVAAFDTPAEFRDVARERFRSYDAEPAFAFVAARGTALSPTSEETATPITAAIVAMLEAAAPTLNRRDASRTAAALRYFASPMFWARMRTGFDMSAEETFAAFELAAGRVLPAAVRASWAA